MARGGLGHGGSPVAGWGARLSLEPQGQVWGGQRTVWPGRRGWERQWNVGPVGRVYLGHSLSEAVGLRRRVSLEVLGWPKSLFSSFDKTKDRFFMLTDNFADLGIWSMSALSGYWLPVRRGRGAAEHPV